MNNIDETILYLQRQIDLRDPGNLRYAYLHRQIDTLITAKMVAAGLAIPTITLSAGEKHD